MSEICKCGHARENHCDGINNCDIGNGCSICLKNCICEKFEPQDNSPQGNNGVTPSTPTSAVNEGLRGKTGNVTSSADVNAPADTSRLKFCCTCMDYPNCDHEPKISSLSDKIVPGEYHVLAGYVHKIHVREAVMDSISYIEEFKQGIWANELNSDLDILIGRIRKRFGKELCT